MPRVDWQDLGPGIWGTAIWSFEVHGLLCMGLRRAWGCARRLRHWTQGTHGVGWSFRACGM